MDEQQTIESEIKQVREAMRVLADDNHDLRFQLKCTAQQFARAQEIIEEKRAENQALLERISKLEG